MFSEGALNLSEELYGAFRTTWSGCSIPIFPEVSALVSGLMCPSGRYFLVALLGGCSWYLGSLVKGAAKFSEGLLRDSEQCPGKYFPCLLVSSFLDKEGIAGRSSLLSDGLSFFFAVFPLIRVM